MRKTLEVSGVGRDSARVYLITEMSAFKAEKWAIKALWLIAANGSDLTSAMNDAPFAEFVRSGLVALFKVDFKQAEPLLDEMLSCVSLVTNAGTRPIILADDFEDPRTLIKLRKEIFALHTDFFIED
jgi:hypothetical protein